MANPAIGHRVLVVDDEHVLADSLVKIFELRGYEAKACYSAEEALQLIHQWRPVLAILDVVLPGMNGIELAVLLRAELPSCQVILISGQTVTGTLVDLAAKQGHEFQVHAKPIPPAELLDMAAGLLSTGGPVAGLSPA